MNIHMCKHYETLYIYFIFKLLFFRNLFLKINVITDLNHLHILMMGMNKVHVSNFDFTNPFQV